MEIQNRKEIISRLAELLKQFEKERNHYQTDVYLYLDEQGKGTLDTFVNIGGNSSLNDEHYVLYTDKEHYDGLSDWFCEYSNEMLAKLFQQEETDFLTEVCQFCGLEEGENLDFKYIWDYLSGSEERMKVLQKEFESCIETNFCSEFQEKAEVILLDFERNVSEQEAMQETIRNIMEAE